MYNRYYISSNDYVHGKSWQGSYPPGIVGVNIWPAVLHYSLKHNFAAIFSVLYWSYDYIEIPYLLRAS